MPLYEFECRTCTEATGTDSTKEILVRSTSETPICPDCGGEQLVRVMSATAAPAMGGRSLPVSSGSPAGEACGAPRCCGGGCQF